MIRGINHVTFSVSDVERSFTFYRDVLGCRPLCRWPKGAYFLAGDLWVALVYSADTRRGPLPEYSHVAFDVAPEDFAAAAERIRAAGAFVFKDNVSEGDSLYFLDPDGHKLEIHASNLEARLSTARERPWEGLELFD